MISIHALLAESDLAYPDMIICTNVISIHALLAESDCQWRRSVKLFRQFLSTLSLRRATRLEFCDTAQHTYFYPRSPCGERRGSVAGNWRPAIFLSTLSLRRATEGRKKPKYRQGHFYPRSPCGERLEHIINFHTKPRFLSTLSLRRATAFDVLAISAVLISIHALLAESDCYSLRHST